MAEAVIKKGESVQFVDYTAGADVAAGEVKLLGNLTGITCGIAHLNIDNTKLGSLAVGGGVYEVVNLDNAANYAKVYWENTAKKATTTSTNNAQMGFIVEEGGGGANSTCLVLHHPLV